MEQGEQQTAYGIGDSAALVLQISEYQPPEQHLLHKGRQKNHDQQRDPGRIVNLCGNGGVIEIGMVVHQQPRQAVHQLIEAVQGDQTHHNGLAGVSQIIGKIPGGAADKAVEDQNRHGEKRIVINGVLQGRGDAHRQQPLRQAEQRCRGKGEHHQIDHKKHRTGDLLAGGHIGRGFSLCHCRAPFLIFPFKGAGRYPAIRRESGCYLLSFCFSSYKSPMASMGVSVSG